MWVLSGCAPRLVAVNVVCCRAVAQSMTTVHGLSTVPGSPKLMPFSVTVDRHPISVPAKDGFKTVGATLLTVTVVVWRYAGRRLCR